MDLNANLKGGWGCVGYAIGISILMLVGLGVLVLIEVLAKNGY